MYIERSIQNTVLRTADGFKALLVTGPRQVGKSTLLKHLYRDIPYLTFDNPLLLAETKSEPGLFFRNNKPPVILDEVQYIAELFSYIKIECDNSEEKGRFLLTGSQQYHLMKNVSESLAGRVGIIELSGLSLREIQKDPFLEPFVPTEEYIKNRSGNYQRCDRIWEIIHKGGYPALYQDEIDWQMYYASYVQTYLDRDINELGNVKDKVKFTQFLTAIAARTGQLLNYAGLADQLEIAVSTVREWVSLLETSGIVYIMQPYTNSALNRAIKTPKIYFRDTGLVCFLTKYQTPDTAKNGAMAGALFETFVVSEILKSFSNVGRDYRMNVSYYRGKDKARKKQDGETVASEAEIDIIIEQDGIVYPIEIKMSANPKLAMTNAFDVLDKIPDRNRGIGVILCMYEHPLWLKDNIVALPVEFV